MIGAHLNATIPEETVSSEQAYMTGERLVEALGRIHPSFSRWCDLPNSPKDQYVSVAEKAKIIERIERKIAKYKVDFAGLPHIDGASLSLTTAANDKEWRKAGCATLEYNPVVGRVAFGLKKPLEVFGQETATVLRRVLILLVEQLPLTFAHTDVKAKVGDENKLYQLDHALYQHREYFGWMGFITQVIRPEDMKDAAEVIRVGEKGTVIVSVPGIFDMADPEQVKQVHRVEMQLAHFNLLPVTGPSLE